MTFRLPYGKKWTGVNDEKETLKSSSVSVNREHIIITTANKGVAAVIVDVNDYVSKPTFH